MTDRAGRRKLCRLADRKDLSRGTYRYRIDLRGRAADKRQGQSGQCGRQNTKARKHAQISSQEAVLHVLLVAVAESDPQRS